MVAYETLDYRLNSTTVKYVTLSNTDLEVSRISLGTMTFGSQVSEPDALRMVDACLDAGINFFDTANVYNRGLSETILGRCLGSRRKDVVLASKARGDMGEYIGLSPAALRRAVEDSLRRLGTDYLDLYYLHQPDYDVPIEESLEVMEALRQEGKVRYTAHSNYAAWQAMEMISICNEKGWSAPLVSQPMYNLVARGIEQEYVPFARRHNVSMIVYNPLAGGLLTGKQSLQDGPATGTRFDGNEQYQKRYWRPGTFDAVRKLNAASNAAGRTPLETAFRWLLDQEVVSSVLVGASSLEQLRSNLEACESSPLSADLREACDDIWAEFRGPVPQYNR